jgi:hypothetical protein
MRGSRVGRDDDAETARPRTTRAPRTVREQHRRLTQKALVHAHSNACTIIGPRIGR